MVEKNRILFEDKLQEISASFIKDGWVTIYFNSNGENEQDYIYCCLVHNKIINSYCQSRDWKIIPGSEGRPSLFTTYRQGKKISKYEPFAEKGIEPFVYSKFFSFEDGNIKYIDIAEEFVLYFKLFERGENKQNRSYYYITGSGELDEVILVKDFIVQVRQKYLLEFLSVKKCHLSVCFDFMRFSKLNINELAINQKDEEIKTDKKIYSILIQPFSFWNGCKTQSWIHGKLIISPPKAGYGQLHFETEKQYAEFIVGYDEQGKEKLVDCKKSNEKYFLLTFFRKDVLDKYYNEPSRYEVTAMDISSNFFRIKLDNNHQDYVVVFLVELSALPYKEQLHWKHYNVSPKEGWGLSRMYYDTMINGNWGEHPEQPDQYFKYKYLQVNEKWKDKFGWEFYKPLHLNNKYRFTSLHIPTTNNIKSFCEQMHSLVIITIDSLNEKELGKDLNIEPNERGITKLERFLQHNYKPMPGMINFLRNLQNLRSGFIAHRFNSTDSRVKKAMEFFGMNDNNYIDVATDIFSKSIWTLNSLENNFLEKGE